MVALVAGDAEVQTGDGRHVAGENQGWCALPECCGAAELRLTRACAAARQQEWAILAGCDGFVTGAWACAPPTLWQKLRGGAMRRRGVARATATSGSGWGQGERSPGRRRLAARDA